MRLLKAESIELREFVGEEERPDYAILSHTWGKEEVSFQEMLDPIGPNPEKEGYKKIRAACDIAFSSGLAWIWIDTICIDKSSSAELSEAINSMYQWYKSAKICYAYLADFPTTGHSSWRPGGFSIVSATNMLQKCRWFTRGWTLQELIAPAEVAFYSGDWAYIATKSTKSSGPSHYLDFCQILSTITGIHGQLLDGRKQIDEFSIAARMSWAARRTTTRSEDIAYCLLGLFDVNIPLLYGEGGKKAFNRLQEELMKYSDDQSLFSWIRGYPGQTALCSLLAESPADFLGSNAVISFHDWTSSKPYSMTNTGLRITLPLVPATDASMSLDARPTHIGALNCVSSNYEGPQSQIAIELRRLSPDGDQYARVNTWRACYFPSDVQPDLSKTIYIRKHIVRPRSPYGKGYSMHILQNIMENMSFRISDIWPPQDLISAAQFIRMDAQMVDHVSLSAALLLENPSGLKFAVILLPRIDSVSYTPHTCILSSSELANMSFDAFCRLLRRAGRSTLRRHIPDVDTERTIADGIHVNATVTAYEYLGERQQRLEVYVNQDGRHTTISPPGSDVDS